MTTLGAHQRSTRAPSRAGSGSASFVAAVLAALALLAGAPDALAGPRGTGVPLLYEIEGYLDRAPANATVLDRITLGAGSRRRVLQMTAYRQLGSTSAPWLLTRNLGMRDPDFTVRGPATARASIFDAAPGSRLHGTFQYLSSQAVLIIDPHALTVEAAPAPTAFKE